MSSRGPGYEGRRRRDSELEQSFDELLARSRDLPSGARAHILDGTLVVADAPTPAQEHVVAEITATLLAGSPDGDPAPAGWSFLSNVELALGPEILVVADIAGWRLASDALATAATPVRVPPSWVCEVLGAGASRTFTLTAKRREYARVGVSHLWIADPESRVLEVFTNQRGRWLLVDAISDAAPAPITPFEDVRIDAQDLWVLAPSSRGPTSQRNGPKSQRR